MSKRIVSLLLALMLVCVGAVCMAEDTITITYKYSDADGAAEYPVTATRGEHTFLSPEECGFEAADGQAFDCWLWYMQAGSTMSLMDMMDPEAVVPISSNSEIIGNWYTPGKICRITFNMNGGKVDMMDEGIQDTMDPGEVELGRYGMLPPAHQPIPPTEDLAFSHWEIDGQAYPGHGIFKVTGDVTAKAVWADPNTLADCDVVFVPKNGTQSDIRKTTKPCLYTLPSPEEVGITAPEGMRFKAWRWNGKEYAVGGQIRVVQTARVSAVWEEDVQTAMRTVSFDADGGTGTMEAVTREAGSTYYLPPCEFEKEGHNFAGWLINGEGEPLDVYETITLNADTTLVAAWDPYVFNIHFSAGIGEDGNNSAGANLEKTYGMGFTLPDPSELGFTCKHHEFIGWTDETNGPSENATFYAKGAEFVPKSFTILVAKWKPLEYKVSFLPGAGTTGESAAGEMADGVATYGDPYSLPECSFTAPTGHQFKAWLMNGRECPVGTSLMAEEDTTVTALWEIKTYKVTYELGDGMGAIRPVEVTHGEQIILPEPDEVVESKVFDYWLIDGEVYRPGQPITVTSDITVVAQWKTRPVKITYENDAGETLFTDDTVTYGRSHIVLTLDELNAKLEENQKLAAPEGYEFGGWLLLNTRNEIIGEHNERDYLPVYSIWKIRPNWVKKSVVYRLTLDMNGGDALNGHNAYEGGYFELPRPEVISHPNGLEFDYFDIGDGSKYYPGEYILATKDVTAKAIWIQPEVTEYTVTYDPGEGSGTVKTETARKDEKFPLINPSQLGFTAPEGTVFKAWRINGVEYPMHAFIDVTEDITAVALWEGGECTVRFDANGGSGTMTPLTIEKGEAFTLPACSFTAPEGKRFKAWLLDGHELSAGTVINPIYDTLLKAVWEDKPADTCVITFVGEVGFMDSVTKKIGESYVLPECGFQTPINNRFKAWDVNGTEYAAGTIITVTQDLTVMPVWEWISYNVTFDAQGGTGTMDPVPVLAGTPINAPQCGFAAPQGKSFEGWYVEDEVVGGSYKVGDEIVVYNDITLKAVWQDQYYTVTYDLGIVSASKPSLKIKCGEKYVLPEPDAIVEVPENMEFHGWKIGENKYGPGMSIDVTENITVAAQWQERKVSLTYLDDSGNEIEKYADLAYGTAHNELKPEELGLTAPEGYEFDGWHVLNTRGGVIDKVYPDDGQPLMLYSNWMMKANWTIKKYPVTFEANGGSGRMSAAQVEHGTQYRIPGCLFTAPKGHGFKAWSLNGSEIAAGTTITMTQGMTLKALWQKDVYTITMADSNDANTASTQNVEYGTVYTLPACPYSPGSKYHTFAGWRVDNGAEVKTLAPGSKITIEASTKITALWDFDSSVQTKIEKTEDITTLPPEEKKELEKELFKEMPADLKTVEAVVTELEKQIEDIGFAPETVEVHEVKLMFKPAGSDEWIEATEENFPTAGIRTEFDVPEGANVTDFEFVMVHMFTVDSDRLGTKAGETETLIPEIRNGKLVTTLNGLSPVSIAYKMKDMSGAVADLPETGDPSALLGWITLLGASGMGVKAMKRKKK